MGLSIRARVLLATNLLVIVTGLTVGLLAIGIAGRDIERKLVDDAVTKAAALVHQKNLPRQSDNLLRQIGQLLSAEAVIVSGDPPEVLAASLAPKVRDDLLPQIAETAPPRSVVLGGVTYHLGRAPVPTSPGPAERGFAMLYLLVDAERVGSARAPVVRGIAVATLIALALATAVAAWLANTITRPLRGLAERMDHLADAATEFDLHILLASQRPAAGGEADTSPRRHKGPAEVHRLLGAFERLLAQLDEARTRLADAARMATLGQFAASTAHELRNPLSGIQMNARVLADELRAAGRTDESLELIRREAERMDRHLAELLRAAVDVRAGGMPDLDDAPPEPVRLDELAESALQLLDARCRRAGITTEREFSPDATVALAHSGPLRQVILNLTLNAIEAMPDGGTLRVATALAEDDRVRVSITDTGGGVAPDDGADIFEPFVTTKSGGTGLGLSICRTIAERYGGRIGYDAEPRGSTFWFELPGENA